MLSLSLGRKMLHSLIQSEITGFDRAAVRQEEKVAFANSEASGATLASGMVGHFHCASKLQTSSPGDIIKGEDKHKPSGLMRTGAVFILILLYLDVHGDHSKMNFKMYTRRMIALYFVHWDS